MHRDLHSLHVLCPLSASHVAYSQHSLVIVKSFLKYHTANTQSYTSPLTVALARVVCQLAKPQSAQPVTRCIQTPTRPLTQSHDTQSCHASYFDGVPNKQTYQIANTQLTIALRVLISILGTDSLTFIVV